MAAALSPRTVSAVLSVPAQVDVDSDLDRFAAAVEQQVAADREIVDEWAIGVSRDSPGLTGEVLAGAVRAERGGPAAPGQEPGTAPGRK